MLGSSLQQQHRSSVHPAVLLFQINVVRRGSSWHAHRGRVLAAGDEGGGRHH